MVIRSIKLADGYERAVGGIVGLVSSSATELQATAQKTATNVNTVAAEELGSSVQELAEAAQQHSSDTRSALHPKADE